MLFFGSLSVRSEPGEVIEGLRLPRTHWMKCVIHNKKTVKTLLHSLASRGLRKSLRKPGSDFGCIFMVVDQPWEKLYTVLKVYEL
jgi:hypothetical protein